MFSKQFITLLVPIIILIGGCNRSTQIDPQAEASKIQDLSHQWTAAIISKDIDKILNLYSPDAVQMQSGFQAIVGYDAIRHWYLTWLNDSSLSYTASTISIEVASSCDLAYERGTYSFNQHTLNGLKQEIGKYLTIWKKIGAEWKAVIDTGTPDNTL